MTTVYPHRISKHVSRITKTTVSIYKRYHGGYLVQCDEHGTSIVFSALTPARLAAPALEWCNECHSKGRKK